MRTKLALGMAVAIAVGWSGTASADEDDHPGIAKLAERLSPEGLSGKVLQLLRTDAGRQAVGEALDGAMAWKTRGFERDAESQLEEYLFTRDADGFVTARPERKDIFSKISVEIAAAKVLFEEFSRRADEVAGKISESTDLGRRLKAAWRTQEYRQALFHDLCQSDDDEEDGKGKDASSRLYTAFKRVVEEQFESGGAELVAKPAAFADDDGVPSAEDLERRLSGRELAEERAAWVDLSERCSEPAVAELFSSPLASAALQSLCEQHRRNLVSQARKNSIDVFVRRYLLQTGDRYQWRPDRTSKVDELLRRSREIARELEAEERGESALPPEPAHPLDRKPITVDLLVVTKDEPRPHVIGRLTGTFEDGGTILLNLRLPADAGDEARDVTIYAPKESLRYFGIEKEAQKPVPGYVAYVWLKADSKEKAESVRFAREK